MDLNFNYSLRFDEDWDKHFKKFDASVQEQLVKKINQLRQPLKHRHMKQGLPYFVEQAGGYRIAFEIDEQTKTKIIRFVGTHKQYEGWYSTA